MPFSLALLSPPPLAFSAATAAQTARAHYRATALPLCASCGPPAQLPPSSGHCARAVLFCFPPGLACVVLATLIFLLSPPPRLACRRLVSSVVLPLSPLSPQSVARKGEKGIVSRPVDLSRLSSVERPFHFTTATALSERVPHTHPHTQSHAPLLHQSPPLLSSPFSLSPPPPLLLNQAGSRRQLSLTVVMAQLTHKPRESPPGTRRGPAPLLTPSSPVSSFTDPFPPSPRRRRLRGGRHRRGHRHKKDRGAAQDVAPKV